METTKIAVFKGKQIRKAIHKDEWWFSVVDVCGALTESPDAGAYWRKLKQRLKEEGSQVVTFCHGLKLEAQDGKMRDTDCANTEAFSALSNPSPAPKPNRSSDGLRKSDMNEFRKSKTLSLPLNEQRRYIRPRAIRMPG